MTNPESQPETPAPKPARGPLTQTRSRSLATWIFGGLFIAFLLAVFAFAPPVLPAFKQRILAVVSALLAGLFAYFFTGDLEVTGKAGKGILGQLAIKGSGGTAAFVIVLAWWLSPLSPVETTDLIRLRVLVLDSKENMVDDARVWTTVGGESKKIAGGWELDIPRSKIPADGRITVYADQVTAFLSGSSAVRLGDDLAPSTTVRLIAPTSAKVRGIVLNGAGKALEGVQVSVVGYEEGAVTTGPSGQFVLAAHAADGQQVQLHAEKDGYGAITQFQPAGTFPAMLILENTKKPG
ncbi:MAG: carboxypeptidase-like regulatory domain-containing protein [Thermoanaerobaculia bacterium]